jgi:hypothetical protein
MQKFLKLRPYKTTTALFVATQTNRQDFNSVTGIFSQSMTATLIPSRLSFSGEAWFCLDRYVNTQNSSQRSSKNPLFIQEITLFDVIVGV